MKDFESLTPEEIAMRNSIFERHHHDHTRAVIETLKKHPELDVAKYDFAIHVVSRDATDFEADPELDIDEYSSDVFVDKISYVDNKCFRIDFTEENNGERTTNANHLIIRNGEWTSAPWIALIDMARFRHFVMFAAESLCGGLDRDESGIFVAQMSAMADMMRMTRELEVAQSKR